MTATAIRIIGNYELGEPIGRGGASEVFAGVHRFLGHEVAVKLLRDQLAADQPVDAFLGEAARARAVRHPNLVSVLDFGRDDATGRCYLVMERIPGESLAERLRRVGRMSQDEVCRLGAALADGMQAAHDGGIVHRDLKPANVMLRGDRPTVVDFGLARDLGGRSALETGQRVGTPAYMAPEQLTGGLIAPCVDVWALGVILFEALSGRLPFLGYADGRCPQLFETAPPVASLAPVSPEIDSLVASCLERDPGRRPASMAAVARGLRGEVSERITQDVGQAVGERPADPAASGPRSEAAVGPARARRRRAWLTGGLVVAAAVVAAAVTAMVIDGGAKSTVPAIATDPPEVTDRVTGLEGAGASVTASAGPSAVAAPATSAPAGPPAPAAHFAIEVHSTPSGADVLVAGKRRGRTPARVVLPAPGSILVRKRGFRPARVRVERAGLIDVRLSRARARPRPPRRESPERGEGLD